MQLTFLNVSDDFEVPSILRSFALRRGFTVSNNGGKFICHQFDFSANLPEEIEIANNTVAI